ncbi:VCBS repeat-containing protein [Patescibacteria group bacterium]|nr:VCBS repeat-containing protein [Patescibacteria group bacterium]
MLKKAFCPLISAVIVVAFLFNLGLIVTKQAQAATVYIDADNVNPGSGTAEDPFRSIGQAANVSSAGDTLLIDGGTYNNANQTASPFPITINKELIIQGVDRDSVIIDAGYGTSNIFNLSITGDISIENITFQGYDQNIGGRALNITLGGGVIGVNNCKFDGQTLSWSPIITNISNGATVNIHHSEFVDNKSEAVHFNRVTDSANVNFYNNLVHSTTGSVLGMGPIVGAFNPDNGTLNASFYNNIIRDQEKGAVIFNWSGSATTLGSIYNNVFIGNTYGIDVNDISTQSTIRNNIFIDNTTAVNGGNFSGTIGSATSDFNDFYNNTTDYSSVTGGAGDMSDDPVFISYTTGMGMDEMNLRLQSSTTLIDAGTNDDAPTTDYDDNRRPFGSVVDMGVYEMDYTPPEIGSQLPADGETGVDRERSISFHAQDNDTGLDTGSDAIVVNVSGSVSGSVAGDIEIFPPTDGAEVTDEFIITFVPHSPFSYSEVITAEVSVIDIAYEPNTATSIWTFTIGDEPRPEPDPEPDPDNEETENQNQNQNQLPAPENGFIVTSPAGSGGPHYRLYKADGTLLSSFFAYDQYLRGGFKAFPANINGVGGDEIITIPGWGLGPHLRAFTQSGQEITSFMIYDPGFRGGLQGAKADFDGDGREEIITAPSGEGGPQVRVFRYRNGVFEIVTQFMAYSNVFHGGVNIATGDLTGDGVPELITVPRYGGSANIRIYQYNNGQFDLLDWAIVYNERFHGGANLATGDLNGDGRAELVVAPRSQGGPNVRVFSLNADNKIQEKDNFLAYDSTYRGGVALATGDVDYDGDDELITAPASAGGSNIRVYQHRDGDYSQLLDWFMVGGDDSTFRSGLNIQASDLNLDGRAEIVASPLQGGPRVRVYALTGSEIALLHGFWAYDEGSVRSDISINLGQR